jgi:hypothetical protein
VHYRPVGWDYYNIDRVYGVPPFWHAVKPEGFAEAEQKVLGAAGVQAQQEEL